MIRGEPTPSARPFWQELALAFVAGAAAPLAIQAGKIVREHLAARRGESTRKDTAA